VFQIDFSIDVLRAEASTDKRTFVTRTEANGFDDEFYSPDCDHVPMPVPAAAVITTPLPSSSLRPAG
jgi:hypothetical protein